MSSRLFLRTLAFLAAALTAYYLPSVWAANGGGGHAGHGHAAGRPDRDARQRIRILIRFARTIYYIVGRQIDEWLSL